MIGNLIYLLNPKLSCLSLFFLVLIVIGCVFFLIIIAIVALICIRLSFKFYFIKKNFLRNFLTYFRRRNQRKLDREYAYKSGRDSEDSFTRSGNLNSSAIHTVGGSVRDKTYIGPFTDVTIANSTKNFTDNSNETYGTYRSRTNLAYDNQTDMVNPNIEIISNRLSRPRVDQEEYWRTNI